MGDLTTLQLLGGLNVVHGGTRLAIPEGSKRLVCFVAVHGRQAGRDEMAAALWPDADRARAAGNQRSVMWRLRTAGVDILTADKDVITLLPHVQVDLEGVLAWAHRLTVPRPADADLVMHPLARQALALLPGWYDEWILTQRQDLQHTLLVALESLARHLNRVGRRAEAIEAALLATGIEPLRESTHRELIQAHLAEGNRCEALRSYALYENLISRECGAFPSAALRRLFATAAG